MQPTDEAGLGRLAELGLRVQLVDGPLHADVGARFELQAANVVALAVTAEMRRASFSE